MCSMLGFVWIRCGVLFGFMLVLRWFYSGFCSGSMRVFFGSMWVLVRFYLGVI